MTILKAKCKPMAQLEKDHLQVLATMALYIQCLVALHQVKQPKWHCIMMN